MDVGSFRSLDSTYTEKVLLRGGIAGWTACTDRSAHRFLLIEKQLRCRSGYVTNRMLRLIRLPNCQTLEGLFSAVSTATIDRKDTCCRTSRDIQDLHSFVPLRSPC